jgi:proline iminopeptidase
VKTEEGYIDVPGGKVWYQSFGEGDLPLLCLHGGPGFTHNYIDSLADLADRRRVIFYDQLGCGNSERPDDTSLWTVDRFTDELEVVREALGLDRVHIFGSSWGGMLAAYYVVDRQPEGVESLILCGSPLSMPRFKRECDELRALLPQDVQDTLDRHEESGFTDCPEYAGALAVFYKRHLCRMDPWPDGLERSFSEMGAPVYHTMNGPSEFTVVGNFKDFDVTDRLDTIRMPTLLTCGRHDEFTPAQLEEQHAGIPNSKLVIFEDSAHMPFYEERELYMQVANEFLESVESGVPQAA